MRAWRAVVASALIAAVLPLAAVPASAAPREIRSVTADCVGDSLSGTATLRNFPSGGQVVLTLEQQGTGWSSTGDQVLITVGRSATDYPYLFSVAAYRSAKAWRVVATDIATLQSTTSKRIDSASCAPPTQLPEAPHPLLIPLSLLISAAGALGWRRFAHR